MFPYIKIHRSFNYENFLTFFFKKKKNVGYYIYVTMYAYKYVGKLLFIFHIKMHK